MESDGYGFGEHNDRHEHHEGQGQKHLLFVWKPSGYELVERDGEPPAVGSSIDLGDRSEHVTKIGPSPLPGDRRPCAYLLG
jgi:hypothetical protein